MSYCHWCNMSSWPEHDDGGGMYHCGCGNQWYRTRLDLRPVDFDKLADKCLELGRIGSILIGVEAFPKFHVTLANPNVDVVRYLKAASCPVTMYRRMNPWDMYFNTKPDKDPPVKGVLYKVWGAIGRVKWFDPIEVELDTGLKVPRADFDRTAVVVQTRWDRL